MDKRSRKVCILWAIALALLITTGLFCWLVVVPILGTHRILGQKKLGAEQVISALGGREQALSRLRTYLRLPGLGYDIERRNRVLGAIEALGELGPVSTPVLVTLIESHASATDSEDLIARAVDALANFGPAAREAVPALERIRRDQKLNWGAGRATIALWMIRTSAADLPPLGRITAGDAESIAELKWLMNLVGPKHAAAVPGLIALLQPDKDGCVDSTTIYVAITALGRIGPRAKAALPVLTRWAKRYADDKDMGQAAAEALKKIRSSEAAKEPM